VEAVARLGARLILQQALEDEVTEFIGREPYERADLSQTATSRERSKTTSGRVELERPRVRGAAELCFEARCSARASRARSRR
jgi:transposase-like protein